MARRTSREQIETFATALGVDPVVAFATTWAAPLVGRTPRWLRARHHHVALRTATELVLVRPQRRRPLTPRQVVAHLSLAELSVRSQHRVGLLHQVVVDTPAGPGWVLELAHRNRRFATGLVTAIADATDAAAEAVPEPGGRS